MRTMSKCLKCGGDAYIGLGTKVECSNVACEDYSPGYEDKTPVTNWESVKTPKPIWEMTQEELETWLTKSCLSFQRNVNHVKFCRIT